MLIKVRNRIKMDIFIIDIDIKQEILKIRLLDEWIDS